MGKDRFRKSESETPARTRIAIECYRCSQPALKYFPQLTAWVCLECEAAFLLELFMNSPDN